MGRSKFPRVSPSGAPVGKCACLRSTADLDPVGGRPALGVATGARRVIAPTRTISGSLAAKMDNDRTPLDGMRWRELQYSSRSRAVVRRAIRGLGFGRS